MNQVVAHYTDGRLLKGITNDFLPTKDIFHVSPADATPGSKPIEVKLSDLKAVFFVKDLSGHAQHHDINELKPNQPVVGRKIQVRFKDGEEMLGTTQGYQPNRTGFFVNPVDAESNNERCFVISSATADVKLL